MNRWETFSYLFIHFRLVLLLYSPKGKNAANLEDNVMCMVLKPQKNVFVKNGSLWFILSTDTTSIIKIVL